MTAERVEPILADVPARLQSLLDENRLVEAAELAQQAVQGRAGPAVLELLDQTLNRIAGGPPELAQRELLVLSQPDNAAFRLDLGCDYRRLGRLACAERQFRAGAARGATADAAVELAALCLALGRHGEAADHARAAIEASLPDDDLILAIAWRILADLAEAEGDVARQRDCQARACARRAVFPQPAPASPFETLILSVSGDGNTPTTDLLPAGRFSRVIWFMDHAKPHELAAPPAHHVAFNTVGDADRLDGADAAIAAFGAVSRRPLLNPAGKVAATRRDRLPATLANTRGLITPAVFRAAPDHVAETARALSAADPHRRAHWLLRPLGRHGGQGLLRLSTDEALARLSKGVSEGVYLTRFHPFASADGLHRKYRIVFVGGAAYPYHLAISSDWLVHHQTSGMADHPALIAEEMAFLDDPRRALGDRAYAAIEALGETLGLDFGGVDFSLTPDGEVLVFEANAAMCVHLEPDDGVFSAKNAYVAPILAAFQDMLARAAAAPDRLL